MRGGDSQREHALPCNVFPTLKSSQFGSTVFLSLQMSAIVLQYMLCLNIFPRSPCRILLTLDWTEQVQCHQSSQAPENSLVLVRVTTLEGGWKQISQNVHRCMCLSLYVFLTTCHHTPCYKLTDQNRHATQCSHLNRKHLRTHKAAAPENSIQQGISCWMIVNQPSEHHVQRHSVLGTVGNGGVKANIARRQELRIKKRGKSWTDSLIRGMKRAGADPRVVWPVTSWQVDVTE